MENFYREDVLLDLWNKMTPQVLGVLLVDAGRLVADAQQLLAHAHTFLDMQRHSFDMPLAQRILR